MRWMRCVFFLFLTISCVGTDYIDDPLVDGGPTINIISSRILALMIGETSQVQAQYLDEYGLPRTASFTWESSNPTVATVENGRITAKANGQVEITVSTGDIFAGVRVNVVAGTGAVAEVRIVPPASNLLTIGGNVQLVASVLNINNEVLADKPIEWFSENEAVIKVSTAGLVTATGTGIAEVHAKSEGVKSNSIVFMVNSTSTRMGTFQSAGGYNASGMVTVSEESGKLKVKLSSDFQASIAAGTFIYLANSTSGGIVKTSGLELGQYQNSSTLTFETANSTLNQYKYVIVLCKPFGVTFGYAELKP